MTGNNLKRIATQNESLDVDAAPMREVDSFVAGGAVGELHQRLQRELGMDWDDPIVYAVEDGPIAHKVERKFSAVVGIAALGAGYAAAAKLIF